MDQLQKQNKNLKQLAQRYKKQMGQLQQINAQHENQIDTLLKFNEKLLNIIQKQLNGQKLKKSDMLSLQPISERTQIQSQMFQSQFSNVGNMGVNIATNKILQKKSLNLRPDPLHQRVGRPEPLAIVQKQQQLSIDVDYTGEKQSQQDQDSQILYLIREFRRNVKVKENYSININNAGGTSKLNATSQSQSQIKPVYTEYSMQEIQQLYKSQGQELRRLKSTAIQDANSKLYRIKAFKQSIVSEDANEKIIGILDNIEVDQRSKSIIKEYIKGM